MFLLVSVSFSKSIAPTLAKKISAEIESSTEKYAYIIVR
jgi:hypothetical protein